MKRALLACGHLTAAREIGGVLEAMPLFCGLRVVPSRWEVIKELREVPYDLVLIDEGLEESAMAEIIAKIKRVVPSANVVVLTEGGDGLARASRAGADGTLRFDADAETIELTVRAALRGYILVQRAGAVTYSDAKNESRELSQADIDLMRLVARGFSNAEIAERLFYSENTIKYRISALAAKVGVLGRVQLAVYAVKNGIE